MQVIILWLLDMWLGVVQGSWDQRSLKVKWRENDLEAVPKQPGLTISRIGQDSVYTLLFNVPKTVTPKLAATHPQSEEGTG